MKARAKTALRVSVSLLLIVFLYRRVDPAQIAAVFSRVRPEWVAVLFGLLLLNTALSAFKWKLLLAADGIRIPLRSLVASYLIGSFFNLFLPSNIGGDAYRIYDVARHSRRAGHSFASVFADRLSGFVALVLLGLAFGLSFHARLPDANVLAVPVIAMVLLAIAVVLVFQQTQLRRILTLPVWDRASKLREFGSHALDSITQYRRAPNLFAYVMAISFLFQFIVILCVYLLALSLGYTVPFIYYCIFVPFISLLEALPISIYGLGVRDASYMLFFTPVGMPRVEALTLALAYVLMTLLYSAAGGVIFMLRRSNPPPTST